MKLLSFCVVFICGYYNNFVNMDVFSLEEDGDNNIFIT